jgi:hypothetical protein
VKLSNFLKKNPDPKHYWLQLKWCGRKRRGEGGVIRAESLLSYIICRADTYVVVVVTL